jgi:hypothetical protein
MAKPQSAYPQSATNRDPERPQEGREALDAVIEEYGGEYADVLSHTDDLEGLVEFTVMVLASVDDEEISYITDRIITLLDAGEVLAVDGTVELAESAGENAADLATALDRVIELEREDQLEDLLELAATASELELDEGSVHALNSLLRLVSAVDRTATSITRVGRAGAGLLGAGVRALLG